VAEKLGIRSVYVSYCPIFLPSPHHPPHPLPGRPFPPDVTDNRVLNDLDVQSYNALLGAALNTHRASIGLPPVDNVRAHVLTGHPWLAADPTHGRAGGVPGRRHTTGVRGLRQHARPEGHWSTSGGALLVMAARFVTKVQAPCCAQWLQANSYRS
jgi:hypothetical protein